MKHTPLTILNYTVQWHWLIHIALQLSPPSISLKFHLFLNGNSVPIKHQLPLPTTHPTLAPDICHHTFWLYEFDYLGILFKGNWTVFVPTFYRNALLLYLDFVTNTDLDVLLFGGYVRPFDQALIKHSGPWTLSNCNQISILNISCI